MTKTLSVQYLPANFCYESMLATRCDGVARVVGVELMIRDGNRGGGNRDDAVTTSAGVFDPCCSADSIHVQSTTSDVRRRVRMAAQYVLHAISGEHFDQPRTDADKYAWTAPQ